MCRQVCQLFHCGHLGAIYPRPCDEVMQYLDPDDRNNWDNAPWCRPNDFIGARWVFDDRYIMPCPTCAQKESAWPDRLKSHADMLQTSSFSWATISSYTWETESQMPYEDSRKDALAFISHAGRLCWVVPRKLGTEVQKGRVKNPAFEVPWHVHGTSGMKTFQLVYSYVSSDKNFGHGRMINPMYTQKDMWSEDEETLMTDIAFANGEGLSVEDF